MYSGCSSVVRSWDAEAWLKDNVGRVLERKNIGSNPLGSLTTYVVEGKSSWIYKQGKNIRGQPALPTGGNPRYLYEFSVKASVAPFEESLLGQYLGLRALAATQSVTVPQAFHVGEETLWSMNSPWCTARSYLIMEHVEKDKATFEGVPDSRLFGRLLAKMHRATPTSNEARSGLFGFSVDTKLGDNLQPNNWNGDWPDFFRKRRIGHQLAIASDADLEAHWQKALNATDGLHKLFEGIKVNSATQPPL